MLQKQTLHFSSACDLDLEHTDMDLHDTFFCDHGGLVPSNKDVELSYVTETSFPNEFSI